MAAASGPPPSAHVESVDTRFLETLLGYNARRAALFIIEGFLQGMAAYKLRPVDFSILSLIHHNPGITSRQLCSSLGILPPNLVGRITALSKRGLLLRQPHPHDGRAMGLHLTSAGKQFMAEAEATATRLEVESTPRLSGDERATLIRLLQKIYR